MRVSREKALENREQIVETAARLLRKHGFDGIGVADIMKAAGLTHGGFYRNFASKNDLAVKASEHAITGTKALLKNGLAQTISRSASRTHRTVCFISASRRSRFRVHSAGVGRGRGAARRSRSPRRLLHGDTILSRPYCETIVRTPKGDRQ